MFLHLLNFKGLSDDYFKVVISNDSSETIRNNHEIIYSINNMYTYNVDGLDPVTNSDWNALLNDYCNHKYFMVCKNLSSLEDVLSSIDHNDSSFNQISNVAHLGNFQDIALSNECLDHGESEINVFLESKLVDQDETLTKYNMIMMITKPGVTVTIPKTPNPENADQIIVVNMQIGVAYLKDENLGSGGLIKLNTLSSMIHLIWNGTHWAIAREQNVVHCLSHRKIIDTPNPTTNGRIGSYSLAVSPDGQRIAASGYKEDNNQGNLYIFKWNVSTAQWDIESEINGSSVPTTTEGVTTTINYLNYRGAAFNFDGTKLFLGDIYYNNNNGCVHYFVYDPIDPTNKWKHAQRLSVGGSNDFIGYDVACTPDAKYVIAGEYADDAQGTNAGAGHVYVWDSSTLEYVHQAVLSPDTGTTQYAGWSVDISADGAYAVIGAPYSNVSGFYDGRVYYFSRNGTTWTKDGSLTTPYAATENTGFFGYYVDLSDDGKTLCAAAFREDVDGHPGDGGRLYVFVREDNTWTKTQEITSINPEISNAGYLGRHLQLSGDGKYMIVGADAEDAGGLGSSGRVYLYKRRGNIFYVENQFESDVPTAAEFFGIRCSLSSDAKVICIATLYHGTFNDQGRLHVFT